MDSTTNSGCNNSNLTDEYDQFMSYYRRSRIPPHETWPQKLPIYVSASARAPYIKYTLPNEEHTAEREQDDCEQDMWQHEEEKKQLPSIPTPFPLNSEIIHFEGPLFEGLITSRIKGVPEPNNLPIDRDGNERISNSNYFKDRSRKFQWTVQGKFKRRTRFDQVVTGQDFGRPFRNAPAASLVKRGLDILKSRLPDSFICDLFSEKPLFEHPLVAGCQFFRVDREEKIQIRDDNKSTHRLFGESETGEIIEDLSLLNDPSVPTEPEKRRKYFSKQENLEKFYFEPNLVYSFDFFANFFSPPRHSLELTPFFCVDLIPYFNGYPLFMAMAKEKSSGKYLWGTEMWHKRLMNFNEKPGLVARLLSFKQVNRKS